MAQLEVGRVGRRRPLDHALPLVPFIDFLLCLVAFLLVTAVWTHASRLQASANAPSLAAFPPAREVEELVVHMQDRKFSLEWRLGRTVLSNRDVPLEKSESAAGDLSYPALADAVRREYTSRVAGQPGPRRAVLRANNSVEYRELVAAMDAIEATTYLSAQGERAGFEIALAAD